MNKTQENETVPEKGNTLWVVSELYYPEMTSTGYYLTRIAEGLAQTRRTSVICGQPNYSARGQKAAKRERLNGVDIHRVFGTTFDKNVIPFRIINMLTLSISILFRSLFSFKKGDQVLVVTNPPMTPFLTAIAAKLKQAEHILLIHDCYPEILYAAGKLKERALFARFLEMMSRTLLRKADRLILVGRDMKVRIEKKIGRTLENAAVIPNWAELETVSPAQKSENELLKELGLLDKTVFLYAGNMGYPNDIETFIDVAEDLQIREPSIHFIFLGAGVKRPLIETAVKALNLSNITLLESRPREEQQIFLNACDVGIVSLVRKMRGVSMPSRTYNILAAGKPILALCDPESEIAMVVKEECAGWVVAPDDPDALRAALIDISSQKERLDEYGSNARDAALAKYSLETAVEKYRKALSGLELSD